MLVFLCLLVLAICAPSPAWFTARKPSRSTILRAEGPQTGSGPASLGGLTKAGINSQLLVLASAMLPMSVGAVPEFETTIDSFRPSRANPFAPAPAKNKRQLSYSVELTDPPSLLPRTPIGERGAITKISNSQIVVLGCHLYTPTTLALYDKSVTAPSAGFSDVLLACSLIKRLASEKPGLIIGLDNVAGTKEAQQLIDRFLTEPTSPASNVRVQVDQLVADLASSGQIYNSLVAAASSTATASSKSADLDMVKALLQLAKDLSLAVCPLALPPAVSKTLLVEGLDGFASGIGELVPDPEGFISSVQGDGFARYANSAIKEDYNYALITRTNGAPPQINSGEKYFSNRILLDETLASKVVATVRSNVRGASPVVLVSDITRVRFGYGLTERLKRLLLLPSTATSTDATAIVAAATPQVTSIMLNPTPSDSLSSTNQLRLSLGYGIFLPSSRPLCDFIWYTSSPPSRVLSRTKNPINREGDRPEGESSVLGAF